MIWLLILIIWSYCILIAEFALAYERVDFENPPIRHVGVLESKKSIVCFTVIIPYRNEAHNLPDLLNSIVLLEYPKEALEVILVNDDSQDRSQKIILDFIARSNSNHIRSIPNERRTSSPKKDAITTAIKNSRFDWIVTTDADCSFQKKWLTVLSQHIQSYRPKMVVGPVRIGLTNTTSFLNAFEQLDFLSLMGATLGGFGLRKPFLCNGAHLAYQKEAFKEVAGFSENSHIASGDDHFLLEKFTRYFSKKVTYLKSKEAIVTTRPQKSWSSLISQRTRWAAKSTGYTYWFSKFVGIVVFLTNIAVAIMLLYVLAIGLYASFTGEILLEISAISQQLLVSGVLLKFVIDYWLISRSAHFMQRRRFLKWFPLVALCYPILNTYIVVKAFTSGFTWKQRAYKR